MQKNVSSLIKGVQEGDSISLARALSLVENEHSMSQSILLSLNPDYNIPVLGVTGPPGAGKSTLINSLIDILSKEGKRIAILAVDPSSPFNKGALLGDRIRMGNRFNDPNVFIRSIANRGALGGLSEKAIELCDVFRSAPFDLIIIETVGVGQSEIDVVGLADFTIVVLVPEGGDEIQHVKSGVMEIADIFVVNKSDRNGADIFASRLQRMLTQKKISVPVMKTVAEQGVGVENLIHWIKTVNKQEKRWVNSMLVAKAWRLIQKKRMMDINKSRLEAEIVEYTTNGGSNIYKFINDNY